ncbi:CheR family methyltransferase [Halorhodospira halochloris]|uniref:CheR family methyltransferase n=1 Tax=Halorhodospira halochloris TaxID=1052 RepID=UPI001EE93C6E|nr:protein-glutamate O-methyltransferase CheR [Halorhodospira halochloris]MCG5548292.1 protein-glutamate O-methyltransferase CheR [Halorhodospira halochloris]
MAELSIKDEDYRAFARFLERACGIVLGENKQYLVASRLAPVLQNEQIPDLGELVKALERRPSADLKGRVIEAMTTNETQWFRDTYPFDVLRKHILPEMEKQRIPTVRIWSAACSSGQETYSISMTVEEYRASGGRIEAEIIGTDISPAMIDQARRGRYTANVASRGLASERQKRFFDEVGENTWEVKPNIRKRASFKVHNLLESYSGLGRFDVIYCRNVLIYFGWESRRDIINRMAQITKPGGFLVVGASESLARHSDAFELIRLDGGVVYKRK